MKHILKLAGLALIPFVLLEVGLRLAGIGGSIIYKEHPAYGYRPAPSQRFSTLGHTITILNNGYRGPIAESDTLFVGDSVTYGTAALPDEDVFPAMLGGMNGGVNGWGPQNVARFLEVADLSGVERVVWVIPSCDVLRPFMTLRSGLISTNRRMLLRSEYLVRFLWYGLLRPHPVLESPAEFEPNVRALLSAYDMLGKRGIELLVIFMPTRAEAAGERTEETEYFAEMAERVASHGVRTLMIDYPQPGIVDYYRDIVHLTREGNRWLADLIAGYIRAGR